MQRKSHIALVRVLVEMINALGISSSSMIPETGAVLEAAAKGVESAQRQ